MKEETASVSDAQRVELTAHPYELQIITTIQGDKILILTAKSHCPQCLMTIYVQQIDETLPDYGITQ